MTKQAERDYPLKIDVGHLYSKPYNFPTMLRAFGAALDVLRKHHPAGSVLDLGCGPGWTSLFLARAGYSVVGIDISERMIEIARERAELEAPGRPLHFEVQDVEELSLERRDFDAVLLFDALHHCPGHVEVLRRAAEHLRPGGHLLLLEPSWLHRYSPHARAHAKQFGVTELGFSRRYLRRHLLRAGFRRVVAYHEPGAIYRGLGGFLWATLRLWLGFAACAPHVSHVLLAEK